MKNKFIFMLAFVLCVITHISAQSTADKINATNISVNKTNESIHNTSGTINETKGTVKELGDALGIHFGKKKPKMVPTLDSSSAPTIKTNIVHINILAVDYPKLKLLEDTLKNILGVSKTTKKFSAASSTLDVCYAGNGDVLWDALPNNLKALFVVKDVSESLVSLEMANK